MKKIIVISVGGSIVNPDNVDTNFLKRLKTLTKSLIKKYRLIIVIGGGKTCRKYQKGLSEVIGKNHNSLDWIGIYSTWLNAELVRLSLNNLAYKEIIKDPTKKVKFKNVLIAGGWKPGWSSDYDAVLLAKLYKAKTVINMSNVDRLYTKDPNKYKNAEKITITNWKKFRKIVGNKWKPGLNMIFDPIAAKQAQKQKLKLVLIGKNLNNLKNLLNNKKFKGSVVKS